MIVRKHGENLKLLGIAVGMIIVYYINIMKLIYIYTLVLLNLSIIYKLEFSPGYTYVYVRYELHRISVTCQREDTQKSNQVLSICYGNMDYKNMLLLSSFFEMPEKLTHINILGTFLVVKGAYWLRHACPPPCLSVRLFLRLSSNIKMAPTERIAVKLLEIIEVFMKNILRIFRFFKIGQIYRVR